MAKEDVSEDVKDRCISRAQQELMRLGAENLSLKAQLIDALNIKGVPDGWRLVAIRGVLFNETFLDSNGAVSTWAYFNPSTFIVPILKPIPKPKRRVLVCEWDLEEDDSDPIATSAHRTRIEERDAA